MGVAESGGRGDSCSMGLSVTGFSGPGIHCGRVEIWWVVQKYQKVKQMQKAVRRDAVFLRGNMTGLCRRRKG